MAKGTKEQNGQRTILNIVHGLHRASASKAKRQIDDEARNTGQPEKDGTVSRWRIEYSDQTAVRRTRATTLYEKNRAPTFWLT